MTQIDFYHNAPEKIAAACKLIGTLYAQGRRVTVFVPDQAAGMQLDRLLWIQPATGFVPHVAASSPLAPETPIVIDAALDSLHHDDVLLNLDAGTPPGFSRFHQLIEVVGTDEADRAPARARFKFYRDRGYALAAHDFASST